MWKSTLHKLLYSQIVELLIYWKIGSKWSEIAASEIDFKKQPLCQSILNNMGKSLLNFCYSAVQNLSLHSFFQFYLPVIFYSQINEHEQQKRKCKHFLQQRRQASGSAKAIRDLANQELKKYFSLFIILIIQILWSKNCVLSLGNFPYCIRWAFFHVFEGIQFQRAHKTVAK